MRFKAGLEDVVAVTSEICFIDGNHGRLVYRGYNAAELAERQAPFEEIVYLLWFGSLPTCREYQDFFQEMCHLRSIPSDILQWIASAPQTAEPMDVLRTAVSMLGMMENAAVHEEDFMQRGVHQAMRVINVLPTMLAAIDRTRHGKAPIDPRQEGSLAENFLYMLHGREVPEIWVSSLNQMLVLHADHELNASTFAARVTAATLSDLYAAVTSALGALKGPLHGGANEQVMMMLEDMGAIDNVRPWLEKQLAAHKKIMGFGHRVYKTEDPRAGVLRRLSFEVGRQSGNLKWYDMLLEIEAAMWELKRLHPNVDFYSGSI
ncbi:MAG: citrate synthase, partial [Firmicutes bacterium]|nr:citrate synthase [Bacillota bacterium]